MARGSHVGSEDGLEAEEKQNKTQVWPIGRDPARLLAGEGGNREVKSTGTGSCGVSGERGGLGGDVPGLGC